ncbi:hypothetical protein DACRYDRAFT_104969 [Dacryopinax primogenitus]|uniref:Uncharacterized protein n=1 Tax=Dacryopinax primogenitus (strain DJM 731) TaxID=1858805 RepID=M5GE50_DACPD|nr:uncharacterized protein DACRYDRAFT_104969 [Dacryopinax primogenitus]EJU05082.1 hypothetical protein DACRYDRAFT_104969 [Dacryopinax primogenitus]
MYIITVTLVVIQPAELAANPLPLADSSLPRLPFPPLLIPTPPPTILLLHLIRQLLAAHESLPRLTVQQALLFITLCQHLQTCIAWQEIPGIEHLNTPPAAIPNTVAAFLSDSLGLPPGHIPVLWQALQWTAWTPDRDPTRPTGPLVDPLPFFGQPEEAHQKVQQMAREYMGEVPAVCPEEE